MGFHGFRRLFIANRGEVATRIARTCVRLGIEPVFGVSEADRAAPYLRGHESVVLGPSHPTGSYLNAVAVVQAAKQTRCSALHPGWGFLAESALLAGLSEAHGITFIGPPADVMHRVGQKTPAKRAMAAAGLDTIDGSDGPVAGAGEAAEVAELIGYPVVLKAESGGGGRGMRIAQHATGLRQAYDEASAEAAASFGDGRLYLERYVDRARHIELQVLADRYGNAVHLGERDCTIQRNHQKLIEESPSPLLTDEQRNAVFPLAVRAIRELGYVGAGTLEFLLDNKGVLRFMEANARLQVEHGVTEMRSGVDLVAEQIRIAAGQPLSFSQDAIRLEGHAIECRINAEEPENGFRPCPGRVSVWECPDEAAGRLRIDTHIEPDYVVPPFYDSMLAKFITHAETRAQASDFMLDALRALRCEGVRTTASLHLAVLASEPFRTNDYHLGQTPGWPRATAVLNPADSGEA